MGGVVCAPAFHSSRPPPMQQQSLSTRRDFLASTAAGLAGASLLHSGRLLRAAADDEKPIKVAALITSFFLRSHAHVILENFLEPYLFNGQVVRPNMPVVSFFV